MRVMFLNTMLAAIVVSFLGIGTIPVMAQDNAQWNALYDRIIRLEHAMRTRVPAQPAGPGQSNNQIAAMEQQLRIMTSQMQNLAAQMNSLQQRLNQLENSPGRQSGNAGSTSSFTSNQNTGFSDDGTRVIVDHSGSLYSEPGTTDTGPQVLGQLRQSDTSSSGIYEPQGTGEPAPLLPEPVQSATLQPLEGAAGPTNEAGGGDALYQRSYNNLLQRRFDEAENGFKQFLSRHKSHELSGNAHYWLGESYFARKRYRDAAKSYLDTYRDYPKNRKAPDALFKLGKSLVKLDQKAQACNAYATIASQYPDARAVVAAAAKESKRENCG